MPYPLGHGVSTCSLAPESTDLRNVKMSLTKQKGPYFCRASAKSLHHVWFTSCVGPESSGDITEANMLVWFVTRNIYPSIIKSLLPINIRHVQSRVQSKPIDPRTKHVHAVTNGGGEGARRPQHSYASHIAQIYCFQSSPSARVGPSRFLKLKVP